MLNEKDGVLEEGAQVSITTVHRWRNELNWSSKGTKYCQLIRKANLEKRLPVTLDQSPFSRSVSRSVSQSVSRSVSRSTPVNWPVFYEKYRTCIRTCHFCLNSLVRSYVHTCTRGTDTENRTDLLWSTLPRVRRGCRGSGHSAEEPNLRKTAT